MAERKPPCWMCVGILMDLAADTEGILEAGACGHWSGVRYHRKAIKSGIDTLEFEGCTTPEDTEALRSLHDRLKTAVRRKDWPEIMDAVEHLKLAVKTAASEMFKNKLCEV
ncbi:MAG: hypothetical protein JRD89_13210 [Deltaproteobacteria bacterium]|nr:hypothetical protein [Deltaproteobacteria bacterium]